MFRGVLIVVMVLNKDVFGDGLTKTKKKTKLWEIL